MRELEDGAAYLLAGHAGGTGRADQRTERRAGDRHWPHAKLIQRVDHSDLGQ